MPQAVLVFLDYRLQRAQILSSFMHDVEKCLELAGARGLA
jgi:hypothetical protein